jgi:ParB-like chromosome segregation protein Spo0J
MQDLKALAQRLANQIVELESTDEQVSALNEVRRILHESSPLKHHPVDCVLWVKSEDVECNEYNPNAVAPPEMELLHTSIAEDGYTMPIVTFREDYEEGHTVKDGQVKIVDGFHRRETERRNKDVSESTLGYLPVTDIRANKTGKSDRMASTIRHNRARGSHNIELMSTIVAELVEMGKGDRWICKHIGMSIDEVLRLKQITGLAALFKTREFSDSWTPSDDGEEEFEYEEVKVAIPSVESVH